MYPMGRSSTFRRVWGRYRAPGANQHAPLEIHLAVRLKIYRPRWIRRSGTTLGRREQLITGSTLRWARCACSCPTALCTALALTPFI
jgi:hypothetical protein